MPVPNYVRYDTKLPLDSTDIIAVICFCCIEFTKKLHKRNERQGATWITIASQKNFIASLNSSSEVVEGTHGVLTRAHLWKLRKGKTSNPSFHVIKAISEFFGVDPSYFFESGTDVAPIADDQRQELVRQVALRSSGMGTDELQTVLLMFDSIAKLKNRE